MINKKFQPLHDEPDQAHPQTHPQQPRQSPIQQYKNTIYCILIALMIFTTSLNLFASSSQSQMHRQFLLENSDIFTHNSRVSLAQKIKSEYNSFKYNFTLSSKSRERLSYGQPKPKNRFIRAVIFSQKQLPVQPSPCLFTNGISIISNKTTETGKKFLQQPDIYQWIVFLAAKDAVADDLINKMMNQTQNKYQKQTYDLTIDSDYQFIREHSRMCQQLIYIQNNFIIDSENAQKFVQASKSLKTEFGSGYIGYSTIAKDPAGQLKNLQNLQEIDLFAFKQQKFNQYVYIIHTEFYNLITPFNFVYFNKYTLEEMLVFPILALTQKSKFLSPIKQLFHMFDEAVVQFKQFALQQPKKVVDKALGFCFVSYPSEAREIKASSLKQYVDSINKIQNQNSSLRTILHIPYIYDKDSQGLNQILQIVKFAYEKNQNIKFRIKVHHNKTLSSVSVYESVYNYCPLSSLIISSRFNIKFQKQFINSIEDSYSQRHHYYYVGVLNLSKSTISSTLVKRKQQRFNIDAYFTHFSYLQIFKSDIFKMIHLWALKVDELQFFETEASFVLPLLQMCEFAIPKVGTTKMIEFTQARIASPQQNKQMKYLQKYGRWDKIKDNILLPIKFNSLTNLDLRRGSLNLIPKIIHQIWFRETEVSSKIKKLQSTIKQVNKDYQYKLWRLQNLTTYSFPLSYSYIAKSLQYQKTSGKCFHRWIQALLSYQILYNYGGFYLSLKSEALKPLDPFLKYQLVFSGFYNSVGNYGTPLSVGRQVMGSKIHSYHMRFIIAQLITQQRLNFELNDYQALVGGDVARLSLTNNELYTTTAFGFNLFTYDPYKAQGLCESKTGFCKQYNQAYIALHSLI